MISAIVLTKNEEKNILACLHSLEWCDEIVVVDDYSIDQTIELITKLNKKNIHFHQRHLENDFSKQRNFGLSKARYEWVLFVDADEQVSSSLQFEIVSTINNSIENYIGYYIKRSDVIWGRELRHGESGNIKLIRLGKKDKGIWVGSVHETWRMQGKVSELKNSLTHYPHQTLLEFLQEINYYTTLRAEELYGKGVQATSWTIVLYPLGKFLSNYFIKLGFLDGIAGLVFAIMMSFHSFLVRSKLWQLWQQKK
jgi:glycosyltransferase involved in cell wall biosynthesis